MPHNGVDGFRIGGGIVARFILEGRRRARGIKRRNCGFNRHFRSMMAFEACLITTHHTVRRGAGGTGRPGTSPH